MVTLGNNDWLSCNQSRKRLLEIVRERSLIKAEPGKTLDLASGATSSFYFDIKKTMYCPEGVKLVADLILSLIEKEGLAADAIGGLEVGAIPVATAVTVRSCERDKQIAGFHVRKAPKKHGTRRTIEGYLEQGCNAIIVEDVTTTGTSAIHAIEAVRAHGCKVDHVITVVDRGEGASTNLSRIGVQLFSLLGIDDFDL